MRRRQPHAKLSLQSRRPFARSVGARQPISCDVPLASVLHFWRGNFFVYPESHGLQLFYPLAC
jgi:hypothetical protein